MEFTPGEVDEEVSDFTVAGSEKSNTESALDEGE